MQRPHVVTVKQLDADAPQVLDVHLPERLTRVRGSGVLKYFARLFQQKATTDWVINSGDAL